MTQFEEKIWRSWTLSWFIHFVITWLYLLYWNHCIWAQIFCAMNVEDRNVSRKEWDVDIINSKMFSTVKSRDVNQRHVMLNTLKVFQKMIRKFALQKDHYFSFHDLRSQQFDLSTNDVWIDLKIMSKFFKNEEWRHFRDQIAVERCQMMMRQLLHREWSVAELRHKLNDALQSTFVLEKLLSYRFMNVDDFQFDDELVNFESKNDEKNVNYLIADDLQKPND